MIKFFLILILVSACSSQPNQTPPPVYLENPQFSEFVVVQGARYANTGMAIDTDRDQILHSIWDSLADTSRIDIFDMDMKPIGTMEVSHLISKIQGLSYDRENKWVWIWGTRVGAVFEPYTDCFDVIAIDYLGQERKRISTPVADRYPGAISYVEGGYLWFKANGISIARLYDIDTLELITELDTETGGEGIFSDGENIWVHGNCMIRKLNIEGELLEELNSPSPLCGAEGLAIDSDGRLWVSTDDEHHNGVVGGNRVWRKN